MTLSGSAFHNFAAATGTARLPIVDSLKDEITMAGYTDGMSVQA